MGAELDGLDSLNATIDDLSRRWGDRAVVYVVGTNVSYSAAVEFGTSPHVITPDDAEVLKFTVDGETVYARSVDHPGTEAQPYMRPAVKGTERKLQGLADSSTSLDQFMEKVAATVEAEAKARAPVDTNTLRSSIRYEEGDSL